MTKFRLNPAFELEDFTKDMLLLRFETKEAADAFLAKCKSVGRIDLHHTGGKRTPRTGVYKRHNIDKMHLITLKEVDALPPSQIEAFEVKYGLYEDDKISSEIERRLESVLT